MTKKACKLERSDMPGLVRLRCQGCGFYAAIDVSGLSDKEREKLVLMHAQSHEQHEALKPDEVNPILDEYFEERMHKEGGATVARVKTEQLAKLAEQQAEEPEAVESEAAVAESQPYSYYRAHPEKAKEINRRWRERNPDKVREYGRRYRERQRAQAASKPEPEDKPNSQRKASPPRDERGRYVKRA